MLARFLTAAANISGIARTDLEASWIAFFKASHAGSIATLLQAWTDQVCSQPDPFGKPAHQVRTAFDAAFDAAFQSSKPAAQ